MGRPSYGTGSRPSVGGNRPNFGNRPSQGQLQDFLNLPGQAGTRPGLGERPSTLPSRPDRPDIARPDRPNLPDRPNIGDRPVGPNRPNIGDRPSRPDIGNDVRDRWQNRPDRPFDKDWWNRPGHGGNNWHWHNHWHNYPPYWGWRPATWTAIGTWFPWTWAKPYYYDYGTTIVYQDNAVYYGDQQVATAAQYAQQAETLADSVPADIDEEKVEWMPLGVFEIAQDGVGDSSMLMQLAVSKEGIIAGTYYNEISGKDVPVEGMVDQKTQRAAWRFVDDSDRQVTFETGIYNLTKDETKCLVHFGTDKTQTWTMIRVPPPADAEQN